VDGLGALVLEGIGGRAVVELDGPVVLAGSIVGDMVEQVPIADTCPSQHSMKRGFKVLSPQHSLLEDEKGKRDGYLPQHWSFFSLSICPTGTQVSSLLKPSAKACDGSKDAMTS
jgi:hypothetical protein